MNPSTLLARAVVAELAASGVREVVLCPGSRSAPLAYALHAADAAGLLRLHVRHDERAAAFTALGAGRVGPPAAVVTTSGTAVANLHPAVLEAAEAGVGLLVLTADRPHALRGTWANQTTALQASLFGGAVRRAYDLPVPGVAEPLERAVSTWRAAVRDGVRIAAGTAGGLGAGGSTGRPGPVHLDLAFADPLVPDVGAGLDTWPATEPNSSTAEPAGSTAEPTADAEELTGLRRALADPVERTVVVAGSGAGALARALAEACRWPLLAEPGSGARGGPCAVGPYRLLLDEAALGGAVQRAVVLGRPTLSRPVAQLLARTGVEVVQVVRHPDEPAPPTPVRRVLLPVAPERSSAPPGPAPGPARALDGGTWLARWTSAGHAAAQAVDAVLDDEAAAGHLSGPLVAREVAAAARAGELLVVAASNPVRDLDLAAAPWSPDGPRVLANRGLAGIDGTASTAVGAALASGATTRLLVGDLALLHDANGLLLPPGEPEPDLQVVVVNDDGGGIFTGLEHGEEARAATFERLFGTPHGVDLASLCAALGVPHQRVDDVARLRAVLVGPGAGRRVVEVRTDRSRLRALHERVAQAVAQAVAPSIAEDVGKEVAPVPSDPGRRGPGAAATTE